MTRSDTVAFLTCVLPPEGYYCAVIYKTAHPKPGIDKPWQKFFETIEQLADFILQQDKLGRTTYHACATYRDAKGIWNPRANRGEGKQEYRTQQNALMARSLWVDIDTRASNPKAVYLDQQEAAEAVLAFCLRAGLPRPVFVDSGYGLHCYWPLERPLAPDEWRRYANALKALCAREGLAIDPARTADIASILRTPGTTNRKNGERDVTTVPCRGF
jgi:hypothetical protein